MGHWTQLTERPGGPDTAASVASAPAPRRVGAILWPGVAALLVCVFWTLAESTRVGVPAPFEDAAMLFKYAENLAHGWGITWNPGQAPGATDGATDLGFVLVLAGLNVLGLPVVIGALLTNLAAVFGIGALFGVLNATLWRRSVWLPVALAAVVAGGPVNRYVLSGFSPPVMAFALLAAFTLAALAARAPSTRWSLALFAGAGVLAAVAGWWRPEGFAFGPLVVLFGILLTARTSGSHPLRSVPAWVSLFAPYLALVAAWAALRVSYFGNLLPTSAVMKSGSLHGENAAFSLQFYGSLLLPTIGALVVVVLAGRASARNWWITSAVLTAALLWVGAALPHDFWDRIHLPFMQTVSVVASVAVLVPLLVALAVAGVRRRDGSWLFPVALLTCSVAWIAIATTLDWWGRMQWPLVPVLAAIAVHFALVARPAGLAEVEGAASRRTRLTALAFLTCVGIMPFHLPIGSYFESPFQTNVATALQAVDTSHVRVATTEAGLIPLAVTGSALDTYGHNNRNIASTKGASLAAELKAFQPNVLAVHGLPPDALAVGGCSAEQRVEQSKFSERWSQMVTEIYAYADRNAVTLSRMSQTTPCETWSLWLAADVDPAVRQALTTLELPGTEVAVTSSASGS